MDSYSLMHIHQGLIQHRLTILFFSWCMASLCGFICSKLRNVDVGTIVGFESKVETKICCDMKELQNNNNMHQNIV